MQNGCMTGVGTVVISLERGALESSRVRLRLY